MRIRVDQVRAIRGPVILHTAVLQLLLLIMSSAARRSSETRRAPMDQRGARFVKPPASAQRRGARP